MSKTDELLAKLEARIAAAPPKRGKVVALRPAPPSMLDPVTRQSHIRMIRHLRRIYRLHCLVDQATFGKGDLEDLSDEELVALHRDLNRARECLQDGISFEDAGLLKSQAV